MVLNHLLWNSGARSTRRHSIVAQAYEAKVKRAIRNIARGPIADRTHQLPTLFEHEHPSRCANYGVSTSIPSFPASTASTLAKPETRNPPVAPAPVAGHIHVALPITMLLPPLRPSVLDDPIDR